MVAKAYTLTPKNVIGHCLLMETVALAGTPYGAPLQPAGRVPSRASRTPRAPPAGCGAPFGRPATDPRRTRDDRVPRERSKIDSIRESAAHRPHRWRRSVSHPDRARA